MTVPRQPSCNFTLIAGAATGVLQQVTGVLQASGQTPSRFLMVHEPGSPGVVFRLTVVCDESARRTLETGFTKLAAIHVVSVTEAGDPRHAISGYHGDGP